MVDAIRSIVPFPALLHRRLRTRVAAAGMAGEAAPSSSTFLGLRHVPSVVRADKAARFATSLASDTTLAAWPFPAAAEVVAARSASEVVTLASSRHLAAPLE